MKKLLIILISMILFSCSNSPVKVSNPERETTLELINKIDTNQVYYVVFEDTKLVVLNKQKVVVAKAINTDATVIALLITIIIIIFAIFFIALNFT
jgi:23S rRNA-/tRNA-specific pseudouridylate synthase